MSITETVTNYESLTAESLAEQIVREAAGAPICLTSSFQTEDMVALHMLRRHLPDVPVIFLETGYHFKEVYAYRDRMAAEWNLNLINALPATTLKEHEAQHGLLYIVQPTQCCAIRKVEPLMRSLEPFDWWFTGLRREQSPTRANLRKVEDHKTPTGKQMKKVSILADWTMVQVNEYAEAHGIPQLELYARGYTSIGCEPCTAVPEAGADPRSGRWGGKKLECGIHTFSEKV
jgi:phosphoadenosine phosphosulfate reductase